MVSKATVKANARASRERLIPKLNLKSMLADALVLSGARRLPNFMSFVGLGRYQNAADMIVAGTGKKILTGQGGSSLFKTGAAVGLSNIVEDVFRLGSGLLTGTQRGLPGGPVSAPTAFRRTQN